MKTSNKLLIALAIAIIVVPLLVLGVHAKLYYKKSNNFAVTYDLFEHFDSVSEGFVSHEISKPFTRVNFPNANKAFLTVYLMKDNKSGVKIPEEFKDFVQVQSDKNDVLVISVKELPESDRVYASIYIYSPDIVQLMAANGDNLTVFTNNDSLAVDLEKFRSATLNPYNKGASIKAYANDVSEIFFNSGSAESLNMHLNNSHFKSSSSSYKTLDIKTSGTSYVTITGDPQSPKEYFIDKLSLVTEGKSGVTLENMNVSAATGSLSDSTHVSMPMAILKTMASTSPKK